jgi:hypothetical protein
VNSIFVFNGTVYTAGYDTTNYACYWEGTTEYPLSNGNYGNAYSIFVDNNGNVYTAGQDANGSSCYWLGTNEIQLEQISGDYQSVAYSIYVDNGTVYTAGQDTNGYACYWVGNVEHQLTSGTAYSIFETNNMIYVAGATGSEGNAECWLNSSTPAVLTTTNGSANSITVYNGIVYIAGIDDNANACYWYGKGSEFSTVELTTDCAGEAYGIFVAPTITNLFQTADLKSRAGRRLE